MSKIGITLKAIGAFFSLETDSCGSIASEESTKTHEVLLVDRTDHEDVEIVDDSWEPFKNKIDCGLDNR